MSDTPVVVHRELWPHLQEAIRILRAHARAEVAHMATRRGVSPSHWRRTASTQYSSDSARACAVHVEQARRHTLRLADGIPAPEGALMLTAPEETHVAIAQAPRLLIEAARVHRAAVAGADWPDVMPLPDTTIACAGGLQLILHDVEAALWADATWLIGDDA